MLLNYHKLIRLTLAELLFHCLLISISYKLISGYNYMFSDAVQAVNNLNFAGNAFENFRTQILVAFLIVALVFIAGYFLTQKTKCVYCAKYLFIPLVTGVLVYWQ